MSQETQPPQPSVASHPQSKDEPVPMWLIILLFLLLYWGAVYVDATGGWFDPKVYGPYAAVAEIELYQPKGEGGLAAQGRAVYGRTCVACHQATGAGTAGQYPPLVKSDWVNESEPGRMIRAVLYGLNGPITVNGQSFNNTMVAWGPVLSDEDIAAVITYVRGNKEWNNNAPAVTPERVKAVRDKIKNRPTAFTPDELLKISPAD